MLLLILGKKLLARLLSQQFKSYGAENAKGEKEEFDHFFWRAAQGPLPNPS